MSRFSVIFLVILPPFFSLFAAFFLWGILVCCCYHCISRLLSQIYSAVVQAVLLGIQSFCQTGSASKVTNFLPQPQPQPQTHTRTNTTTATFCPGRLQRWQNRPSCWTWTLLSSATSAPPSGSTTINTTNSTTSSTQECLNWCLLVKLTSNNSSVFLLCSAGQNVTSRSRLWTTMEGKPAIEASQYNWWVPPNWKSDLLSGPQVDPSRHHGESLCH